MLRHFYRYIQSPAAQHCTSCFAWWEPDDKDHAFKLQLCLMQFWGLLIEGSRRCTAYKLLLIVANDENDAFELRL